MKKFIQTSCLAALALLLTCFSPKSYASHYQGSDMTYVSLAPGLYQVTLRLYRDCSGATLGTSESMKVWSPGCNAGRNVTLNQVANPNGILPFGNPYCGPQPQSPCSSSSPANYETRTYQNTVNFSATEKSCNNWLMSVRLGNRPTIENLVNAQSTWLYTEAYLNLNDAINNNSPEISPTSNPIPFVCVGNETTFSMNAADPDNDSLSYELSRPLDDYQDPIPYAVNNNQGGYLPPNAAGPFFNPTSGKCEIYNTTVLPTCTAFRSFPNGPGTAPFQTAILNNGPCPVVGGSQPGTPYSATYPLPAGAANFDWSTCKTNVVATGGGFFFDPLTGTLTFTPSVFHPNTASSAGRNKYAMAVQINEWRNIGGVMTKVGHIRRDILVIVNACNNKPFTDEVPKPLPIFGATVKNDTVIDVLTCTTTRFMLKFADPDLLPTPQLLNVMFPGATLQGNGSYTFTDIPGLVMKPYTNMQNKVNVAFYMTPSTADVNKNYFLRVNVEDDACPIKGRGEYVYRIHVTEDNRVEPQAQAGNQPGEVTVCLGQSTPINVTFLRPDSILQAPANYTYRWGDSYASNSGLPNGLNAADRFNQNINVNPTQTTRYYLAITSQLNGCVDTTSVLVKVEDKPAITSINGGQPASILYGGSITLTPELANAVSDGFMYEWTRVNDPSGEILSTEKTYTATYMIETDTFQVRAYNSLLGCESTARFIVNVTLVYPNLITPNGDMRNDRLYLPIQFPDTNVKIFNRWGGLVQEFKSYSQEDSFDGKNVSDGTYYYLITNPDGKQTKGWFEVSR